MSVVITAVHCQDTTFCQAKILVQKHQIDHVRNLFYQHDLLRFGLSKVQARSVQKFPLQVPELKEINRHSN